MSALSVVERMRLEQQGKADRHKAHAEDASLPDHERRNQHIKGKCAQDKADSLKTVMDYARQAGLK